MKKMKITTSSGAETDKLISDSESNIMNTETVKRKSGKKKKSDKKRTSPIKVPTPPGTEADSEETALEDNIDEDFTKEPDTEMEIENPETAAEVTPNTKTSISDHQRSEQTKDIRPPIINGCGHACLVCNEMAPPKRTFKDASKDTSKALKLLSELIKKPSNTTSSLTKLKMEGYLDLITLGAKEMEDIHLQEDENPPTSATPDTNSPPTMNNPSHPSPPSPPLICAENFYKEIYKRRDKGKYAQHK